MLVAGICAVVAYFLTPGVAGKDLVYSAIGVASTACLLIGVRVNRPASRSAWCLLAAANACFVAGDAVFDVYDLILHTAVPVPSAADGLYLAGYPLLFAGIFRVSGLRGLPGSRESRADAAIVCVGGLALSWQVLMGSYAHDTTLSIFGKLVTMAYPIMDLGVLFMLVNGLMARTARRATDRLILTAVTVMLLADFNYDLLVLHDAYTTGNLIDAGFLLNYVLMAAAALHPSMSREIVRNDESSAIERRWMPLAALAGFVSPLILLLSSLAGLRVDVGVLAATSLVLFGLVVVRVYWLLSRVRAQNTLLTQQSNELRATLEIQRGLESTLRHQAFHDDLTGLANRALLHDRISHALAASARSAGVAALCLCDLEGSKPSTTAWGTRPVINSSSRSASD